MRNRVWVFALVLGVACDSATTPVACPSLPVTVTVTASRTPTFTWTPNCHADAVIVYEVHQPPNPDLVIWMIEARAGTAGTTSPVMYGQVPAGMRQTTPPLPLGQAVLYSVTIRNAARVEMGTQLFVF